MCAGKTHLHSLFAINNYALRFDRGAINDYATLLALGLLLALTGTNRALAAEKPFEPHARAKTVAPYIDARTIAVFRTNLAQIEVGGLLDKCTQLVPAADFQIERSRDAILASQAGLLEAGIDEVYMVLSLADLPRHPPFFILPVSGKRDLEAVSAAWPQSRAFRYNRNHKQLVEPLGKAIFVGSPHSFGRIKLRPSHARPELAEAFRAAGDTAAQFLLLPTADHRRVIDELLPTLPEELGGGPSSVLTRGLLWAAVGANAPEKTSFQITVQSADDRAAEAFADKFVRAVAPPAEQAKAAGMVPKVEGGRLLFLIDQESRTIEAFLAAVTPPIEQARTRAARAVGINNLKHLGLAMHNWHDRHKSFPAGANFDAAGKPLLSWRVHILPFLEEGKLHDRFHLDEPWDSPHNRQLIQEMPDVFGSPMSKKRGYGYASYLMPVNQRTICHGHRGVPMKEIIDGTSNTIMVVEVGDDKAVIWTKPGDLPVNLDDPAKGLGGLFKDGFQVAFCDGSARFIPNSIDPKTLRALLTRAGREPVGSF